MTGRAERWVWTAAAGFASVLAAVWMDLSPLHANHTSDSLIPILSGLYLWTPFFWEQNRYGSLIPLFALPVDSPFHHLLVQVALRLLAVAASFFLLARTVVPRRYWPAVGASTLALWVAGKGIEDHAFLQMQPYGQAIALSLGGILLLDRDGRGGKGRVLVGLGLLLLGFWISATTLFWLLPLVWVRHAVGLEPGREAARWRLRPERRALLVMFALFAGFDVSMALSWLSRYKESTAFGAARPAVWPRAWTRLFSRSVEYLSPALVVFGLALLVVVIVLGSRSRYRRHGRHGRFPLAVGLCLIAAALADLGVMGTTYWAQVNKWSLRYVTVELLALGMLAPALLLILLLEGRPARWQRAANVLALLLLIPALAWRYGEPSVARARASVDELSGAAEEILASGCNHVLGGYWRTWPEVFRADVLRWERGDPRPVWAIALRSGPTDPLWRPKDWTGVPIAVLTGNEVAAEDMRQTAYLPPLYLERDLGDVQVYVSTPTGGPALSEVAWAIRNDLPRPR